MERAESDKRENQIYSLTYDARLREWDSKAIDIRRQYIKDHPGVLTEQEEKEMWIALEQYGEFEGVERRAKKASGYADVRHDEMDIVREL